MAKGEHPQFSGANLLAERKRAGMSRLSLSRAIDFAVRPEAIMCYEQGRRSPSFNVAIMLARALDIPLKKLTNAAG